MKRRNIERSDTKVFFHWKYFIAFFILLALSIFLVHKIYDPERKIIKEKVLLFLGDLSAGFFDSAASRVYPRDLQTAKEFLIKRAMDDEKEKKIIFNKFEVNNFNALQRIAPEKFFPYLLELVKKKSAKLFEVLKNAEITKIKIKREGNFASVIIVLGIKVERKHKWEVELSQDLIKERDIWFIRLGEK